MGPAVLSMSLTNSITLTTVPKLANDLTNWPVYKDRVKAAIESKTGLLRHLTGTARKPTEPSAPAPDAKDKEIEAYDKAIEKVDEYDQREAAIKQQIYSTIPDSILNRIKDKTTTKGLWTVLCDLAEKQGKMVEIDVHCRLHDSRCQEGGNIRAHLDMLISLQDQLTGMGSALTDNDFVAVILSSLPKSYKSLISILTSMAMVNQTKLTPADTIQHLSQEYDRHSIQTQLDKKAPSDEMALYSQPYGKKGRGYRGKKGSSSGKKCHNCGLTNHIAADCFRPGGGKEDQWPAAEKCVRCLDTGASHHMSPYRDEFIEFVSIPPKPISAADKCTFMAMGRGTVVIRLLNGDVTSTVTLKDVLYAPSIALMLISASRIDSAGFVIHVKDGICAITDPSNHLVAQIPCMDNLYKVVSETTMASIADNGHPTLPISKGEDEACAHLVLSAKDLHRWLGHISVETAKKLVKDSIIDGIDLDKLSTEMELCSACVQAKMMHVSFLKERTHARTTRYGELISTFRTDRGGEFTSDEFETHLKNAGTVHEKTVHDSSTQNGTAERFLRTIVERARTLLIASGLPKFLWAATMSHTVWLWNRTGTRTMPGTTPYEKVHGQKPDLNNLHEWGCKVWVKIEGRNKLEAQADKGCFVGYSAESKGVLVYWPAKRRIGVERNIIWDDAPLPDVAVDIQDEGGDDARANERASSAERAVHSAPLPSDPHMPPVLHAPPTSQTVASDQKTDGVVPLNETRGQNVENKQKTNHLPGLDHLVPPAITPTTPPEPISTRSHRIPKPSEYIRRLERGEGTTTGSACAPAVLRGMRLVP
ncbi:hypothetical protein EW146_g10150, partial [Bondarzewia mesenterica]